MKNIIYILFVLLIIGCRHKDEEFEGPDLNDLYGPFYVIEDLTLSDKKLDFQNGDELIFNAQLSKRTSWIISIVGLKSGAIATIEGSDRIIMANNATWLGGANNFPGFNLEDASITLSFPDEEGSQIYYDTISILSEKIDKGTLITSFENGFGANWSRFNQSTVAGDIVCSDGNAAKGDCYYSIDGTVGWDWAIGSVTINSEQSNFNLQANSNNLFFNLGIKPVESIGTDKSFIQISFNEDENQDGTFDPTSEDSYVYQYWTEDSTWKILSLNYSDLQFDAEGNNVDVNGNGLPEPSKLSSIELFYLSDPNNGNAKMLLDHLIFTTNEPYRP